MAFGIGTNTEHPEHQLLAGAVNEVAVKCWFTSTGRSIPLMMKLQTESDGIIEVSPIQVFSSEKQFYAGILYFFIELHIFADSESYSSDGA